MKLYVTISIPQCGNYYQYVAENLAYVLQGGAFATEKGDSFFICCVNNNYATPFCNGQMEGRGWSN